jgi:hypothetical protein
MAPVEKIQNTTYLFNYPKASTEINTFNDDTGPSTNVAESGISGEFEKLKEVYQDLTHPGGDYYGQKFGFVVPFATFPVIPSNWVDKLDELLFLKPFGPTLLRSNTPILRMLPLAAKTSGVFSLVVGIPLKSLENYYAVKEGRRTMGEAVTDGTVDVGIGFASATAGVVLGAEIGLAVGTVVPVLGNAACLLAGAAIGYGVGWLLTKAKGYALS